MPGMPYTLCLTFLTVDPLCRWIEITKSSLAWANSQLSNLFVATASSDVVSNLEVMCDSPLISLLWALGLDTTTVRYDNSTGTVVSNATLGPTTSYPGAALCAAAMQLQVGSTAVVSACAGLQAQLVVLFQAGTSLLPSGGAAVGSMRVCEVDVYAIDTKPGASRSVPAALIRHPTTSASCTNPCMHVLMGLPKSHH